MDQEEMQTELEQISVRLQQDGLPPTASMEEQQRHLWQKLVNTEENLQSANQELQTLRTQQANEMTEVESYVAHIRGLLEERECVTADYERDNENLRHELHQMKQQQENQSKELAEMLAQEDLGEIALSCPSEQVAYLLVERTTLLERLEAAERRLEGQSLTGSSGDAPQQAHNEEVSQKEIERQRLERDLEEASSRLTMAHQDIRRLTNELDAAKNNNVDPGDIVKAARAKVQNERLDAENRALKDRVHILESEKKTLLDQLSISEADQVDILKEDQKEKSTSSEAQNSLSASSAQEKDHVHKRCQEAMENGLVQVRELQRQLQRLRKEQEELEERNEELEALLGEAQNASKEERYRHEGELEGLHRKVKSLEADLRKQDTNEKLLKNGEAVKATESYLQLHLNDSSQERLALLEARLTEEKDWRKQLEVDLSSAQAALKKDKEALQIGERELKKLRLEINSLQTECQQGKTLIKSLTQVKGEKAVLEEKVTQMERANSRLQTELERCRDGNRTQEDLRENKLHVEQLQDRAEQLTVELSSLQKGHNALRDEMASEQLQTADLQNKLGLSLQEKLKAEEEKERLELEIKHLNEKLKWYQEQLSSTKEALRSSQKPEVQTTHMEPRFSLADRTKDESFDELFCLKQDLDCLEARLAEERQLASQQQLVLQVQVNEAQALIKSQETVLIQKAEETKQMKQDLQRVQSLFTSAERELRYEKDQNMDLKRHNTLLDQEKLKLCAELKQIQVKLIHLEQRFHSQTAECERQQQKIRELEVEVARNSTNRSSTTSLQEELQAERARLIAADKKVLELQQQLKNVQHQLRVEEARAGESTRLERDSRDLSDTLSALRAQQQEEHLTRKLLEQREEELQQQVRSMRLKEASLTRTNTELSHRAQQLDTRLNVLEAELTKIREEVKNGQKSNHMLQEELAGSQQECERLQGELQQVLLQLDTHIRKFNEKHSQHKTKLRQAKQVFLKATAQRDRTIQKLESDLVLTSSLAHKEKERIHTVMEENEKLLEEKRELLRKICEAEDMGSKGMRTASTVQHRVNVLEIENRQLQDRIVKLSNQATSLERALRNAQSLYSLENIKKALPSESFCDNLLQTSTLSLASDLCGPLEVQDRIFNVNLGEHALESTRRPVSTHLQSEQSYLNLTSPLAPSHSSQESSNKSEQV